MVEKTGVGQLHEWYGLSPDSQELRLFAEFGLLATYFAAEVQAISRETSSQLRELFVGAQLGIMDTLVAMKEKTAAWWLRSFFGEPHPELDGAIPVALQLKSNEAVAADAVVERRFEMSQLLESLSQTLIDLLAKYTEQLQLVEAKIIAKKEALGQTAKLELHATAAQDKNAFTTYTDSRLEQLGAQRRLLSQQIIWLTNALGRLTTPLTQVVSRMSRDLTSVVNLDSKLAIPVGPVQSQPA